MRRKGHAGGCSGPASCLHKKEAVAQNADSEVHTGLQGNEEAGELGTADTDPIRCSH